METLQWATLDITRQSAVPAAAAAAAAAALCVPVREHVIVKLTLYMNHFKQHPLVWSVLHKYLNCD